MYIIFTAISDMALAQAIWNSNFSMNTPLQLDSCVSDMTQKICLPRHHLMKRSR